MSSEKSNIRLYLDTSIISAYFDNKNQERQELTKDFFGIIQLYDAYISDITINEINYTPDDDLRKSMITLCKNIPICSLSDPVYNLAQQYIEYKAIPLKYLDDALHIATAVILRCDYLLSWNFKHIVKIKTRNIVKMVNTLNKYRPIDIITPAELLE